MQKCGCLAAVMLAMTTGCTSAPVVADAASDEDANAAIAASVPSTDIVLVSLTAILDRRDPGKAIPVSVRRGYDNQPAFSADGQHVYFSRIADGEQSDVYRFDIANGALRQITRTPQSEYSPTPLADGGFSCIQVALDGTQRLWRYDVQGRPDAAFRDDITGVGYHAWLSADEVALFIVADPMRLEIASLGSDKRSVVATDIGRSVLKTPGGKLSYVRADPATQEPTLYERNLTTGSLESRASLPGDGQDLVWLDDGSVLVADARTLYRLAPDALEWTPWVNLARSVAGDISRMALDPSGQWLALVVSSSE